MARTSFAIPLSLALLGLGPALLAGCVGTDEWPVPSWLPGDHISRRNGVEPRNRTVESWLVGPEPARDLRGETVQAYSWAAEPFGAPGALIDLERGQVVERRRPPSSARDPAMGLDFRLYNGEQWGLALQGLVLRRGMEFEVPNDWSGESAHYRVRSLSAAGAVVDATSSEDGYLPMWPTTRYHFHEIFRWVIEYWEISPYPSEVRVYVRANNTGSEERLANVIRFEDVDLAAGKRRTDRAPPPAGLAPRSDLRFDDWTSGLDTPYATDPLFDPRDLASAARADPSLAAWLDAHATARIVDASHLLLRETNGVSTADVWNVTWRDRASADAYGFVRVAYRDRPEPIVPLLETPPPEDRFGAWQTGPFSFPGPWFEADSRLPQLVPDDALNAYRAVERGMPTPAVMRWTLLPLSDLMPDAPPDYLARHGMWDVRWGEATFRFESGDPPRTSVVALPRDSTWIVGPTGEMLLTLHPSGG